MGSNGAVRIACDIQVDGRGDRVAQDHVEKNDGERKWNPREMCMICYATWWLWWCDGIAFYNIYANALTLRHTLDFFNPILSNGPAKLFLYVGHFGDPSSFAILLIALLSVNVLWLFFRVLWLVCGVIVAFLDHTQFSFLATT